MPKIFISYRRDDNGYAANSIYEKLGQKFDVFFDVHGIPLGVDWKDYLTTNVQDCAVMLVIIGRDWLDMIEKRATQRDDFVRFEIETALNRGIPIIPLFLEGMTGIDEERLPASIAKLASRQGQQIRRAPDFDTDVARLITGIEGLLGKQMDKPKHKQRRILDILPSPFKWIKIPAGAVWLVENYDDKSYFGSKGERKRFDVPTFQIAKYPVTNAQFQAFVDAGDGYHNAVWWDYSADAKSWRVGNISPQTPTFAASDNPRTNVCWYEAVAFCLWLGSRIDANVQLPSEQQWQRAAQGDTNWVYPWGNKWDSSKCNASSKSTSPVTTYEGRGDSPFGVVDLSGNVWEWCSTNSDNGQQDLDGEHVRILRGGSWGNSYTNEFQVDYRKWHFSERRYSSWGFRCAISSK
jgi:formylglycine-generating enzyme required for sulfatase activity